MVFLKGLIAIGFNSSPFIILGSAGDFVLPACAKISRRNSQYPVIHGGDYLM
jgi:hypothetical protein